MPKISIIIPVYNVEPYLRRCIDSVLEQTMQDYEIVVVNDGSTDNSGSICDQYANQYDQIRVIHKQNGGLSDARNTGIKAATGDYILFLDSDDYLDTDALEKLWTGVNKNVDIIIGGYKKIYQDYMLLFQCDGIRPGKV